MHAWRYENPSVISSLLPLPLLPLPLGILLTDDKSEGTRCTKREDGFTEDVVSAMASKQYVLDK